MSSRRALLGASMAGLLATGSALATSAALAAPGDPASEAALTRAGKNAIEQAAEKSSQAMLEVRAARVALFNGLLDDALELTSRAGGNLDEARTALQVYRRVEGQGAEAELRRDWVPFDTTVVEYIDIDSDRQALQSLERASDYLEQGKEAKAAEALSELNTGVSITIAYLPVGSALELLKEVRTLMDDDQYHEANMALKSIENSARQGNYTIMQGSPKSGDATR